LWDFTKATAVFDLTNGSSNGVLHENSLQAIFTGNTPPATAEQHRAFSRFQIKWYSKTAHCLGSGRCLPPFMNRRPRREILRFKALIQQSTSLQATAAYPRNLHRYCNYLKPTSIHPQAHPLIENADKSTSRQQFDPCTENG
jgi:hypothetical protein